MPPSWPRGKNCPGQPPVPQHSLRSCPLAGVARTLSEASADDKPHAQGASATLQGAGAREPASPRTSTSRGRWCASGPREETPPEREPRGCAGRTAVPPLWRKLSRPCSNARAHTASSESASPSISVQGSLKRWHLPSTAKFTRQEPARALKPTPAVARAGEWTVTPRCT